MSRTDIPTLDDTVTALEQLTDVLIAAQEVGEKFRAHGRPFLTYCARQLEDECHSLFHELELIGSGWEPMPPEGNHVER